MCIIDKPSHNSVSHYYSHFTDEEIGSEWLRGSAPGHTAFNSESGIGPPRFVLGAWPALSAVGVGTPLPVPPGVPFSEARHPAGLSRTALYLLTGSEGYVAVLYQPGVAHILETLAEWGKFSE